MNFIEEKILEKGNLENLMLRFPPEPNGYLHIGHAKSMCLNFGLAEKYNGGCNLRFDDTNPSTEETKYINAILEDVNWLGFKPASVTYASDNFEFIYECAEKLITKSLAYVDASTSEEMAEMKGTPTKPGKNSPYRDRPVEESLKLFREMRDGKWDEHTLTLRAKIDMANDNMILRDPVIYRIMNKSHHRTGDTWNIYPMYDMAHPICDYVERITDSLCTLEFEVHRPLYMWFLENLDLELPLPEETEFARLNLDYSIMSKRNLKKMVDEGMVDSWSDPRMPTISGLRRRGYTPEAIKDFCERISVTKRNGVISHLLLEECLRGNLNDIAPRMMGVMNPIKLTITNWDKGVEWVEVENNPSDENAGTRLIPFSGELWIESEDFREEANRKYFRLKLGHEVRLKGGYVVKATECIKDEDGNVIEVLCTYDPLSKSGMDLGRRVKGTIHWVSREHGVSMDVYEYERLFTEEVVDNVIEDYNENSLRVNDKAVFEPSISDLAPGVAVQMMRKGYYIIDTKREGTLNKVVSLKEGWNG